MDEEEGIKGWRHQLTTQVHWGIERGRVFKGPNYKPSQVSKRESFYGSMLPFPQGIRWEVSACLSYDLPQRRTTPLTPEEQQTVFNSIAESLGAGIKEKYGNGLVLKLEEDRIVCLWRTGVSRGGQLEIFILAKGEGVQDELRELIINPNRGRIILKNL
jgi:hypothetical protein